MKDKNKINSCSCGEHEEKCSCGEHEEKCSCGEHEKKCSCGEHEEKCSCGEHEEQCSCGEHEEKCSCGEHEEKCSCGEHEKKCSCGEHEEKCSCGEHEEKCSCGEHEEKCSCGEHEKASHSGSSCCGMDTHKSHGSSSCCGGKINTKNAWWNKWGQVIFLAIGLASLVASFINPFHNFNNFLRYVDFGYIAVILCGYPIFFGAVKSLKKGKITTSVLISIAMICCIVLNYVVIGTGGHSEHGYIFAAGEIAFLMAIGAFIEDFTIRKARAGIEKLTQISPKRALVKVKNNWEERDVSVIKKGDIVLVKAGDSVSCDGNIIVGSTTVNQAVMTGESLPVNKGVGDAVFAGTWNNESGIEIEVTAESRDSTIERIKRLVEEAENKRAPIARLADKWASYVVPSAIILSILVGFISYFALKVDVMEALIRGVTLLVVFCPCSLSLATPTAIAAGIGRASQDGLLVKSGEALEILASVDTFAFDKTGTITEGKLVVSEVYFDGIDEDELKRLMGSAELVSSHPIAKSIVEYCKGVELITPEKSNSKVGEGVEAVVGGKKVWVGKSELSGSFLEKEKAFRSDGSIVVAVKVEGKLVAIVAIADKIRSDALEAIATLKTSGIDCVMLTGDNEMTARRVSEKVGIESFKHSLLPEDKLSVIEGMKASGKKVLMVGDGVNDAPCLATSDVSVAMGNLGSEVAIETADITLLSSKLTSLPLLQKISKRVMLIIKINIIMSICINIASTILSTFGLLDPVSGAIVHNISSILVVTNSALILLYAKRKKRIEHNN